MNHPFETVDTMQHASTTTVNTGGHAHSPVTVDVSAPVPVTGQAGYGQPEYMRNHGPYAPMGNCGWYQAPGNNGQCETSGMAIVQSIFALPSKVVEPALMSLPAGLVPVVGLAVNVGAWWMVWKGVEKYWLGPMLKGK
jgi:hypothetical protein